MKHQRVEKYAHIDYEKRLKIIEYIGSRGYSIQKTASILGINASTARMIMKKFREDGQIFKRKDECKIDDGKRTNSVNYSHDLKKEIIRSSE